MAKFFNLKIHINEPTRGNNCIDHILSNVNRASGGTIPLHLSDHNTAQTLTFPVKNTNKLIYWFSHKRNFCNENLLKFRGYLQSISFSDVYNMENVNAAFDGFYNLFCTI